ncbi:hypothetical protein VI06_01860 [Aquitalea magnusonii]|nr:hypothetical protein VI06_01860 [Aquitalea magnusonii]
MSILQRGGMLLAASMLSACTTMADRLQGSITPPPGYGYIIVSLTAKAFDQDSANVGLHIQDQNGDTIANSRASMNTDTVFGEEGMSPVDGKLLLLALPPGHYQASDTWGNWIEESGWGSQWRSVTLPIHAGFDVTAGSSTYLGEVFLDLSMRPELQLSNQQKRDFGHMRRVWKVNNLSDIQIKPLQKDSALPAASAASH